MNYVVVDYTILKQKSQLEYIFGISLSHVKFIKNIKSLKQQIIITSHDKSQSWGNKPLISVNASRYFKAFSNILQYLLCPSHTQVVTSYNQLAITDVKVVAKVCRKSKKQIGDLLTLVLILKYLDHTLIQWNQLQKSIKRLNLQNPKPLATSSNL